MILQITAAAFDIIAPYRELYQRELGCQIVHDSAHYREGCSQSYSLRLDGHVAGYGSVWLGDYWMVEGSVFEFFVLPEYRAGMAGLFGEFLNTVRPPWLYAQTNDLFLGSLIESCVHEIIVDHVLFADSERSAHSIPGVEFRPVRAAERDLIFPHQVEPVGDWALDWNGRIVATGGVLYHYNRPYGDIFMEVDPEFRRRGLGQFLVQELKRICREAGNVPAARCRPENIASRKTLEKAGFVPCGHLVRGKTLLPD